MKVLVTGGAGFIGSSIADLLIKTGHNVVIIDNLSSGKKEYVNEKAVFYEADVTKDMSNIFEKEKPEIVIHLAAQVDVVKSIKDPLDDAEQNILGIINVLEACRKNNIKKIIYTSTVARYGEPQKLPVDENHPAKPESPYGLSKYVAEGYVKLYSKLYGINYLIFCFGNVYGPKNKKGVICAFIEKMLKNESPEIFGDGEQTRDFIYVNDLANFVVSNLDKIKNKMFNLSNSSQISVNELFSILKDLTGFAGEAKHTESIKGEIRDMLIDTSLAKKELNWNPKHSFKEGLKETFEWFKSNQAKLS
ncbi:NAD-dependent epimerase/dehydratase family protein [Candidatus Woesearchaeota archaeon]|nr:NAD-dependent epimerase/dehydratase family protein [Candidatus Woesearchaeota archaeon]